MVSAKPGTAIVSLVGMVNSAKKRRVTQDVNSMGPVMMESVNVKKDGVGSIVLWINAREHVLGMDLAAASHQGGGVSAIRNLDGLG